LCGRHILGLIGNLPVLGAREGSPGKQRLVRDVLGNDRWWSCDLESTRIERHRDQRAVFRIPGESGEGKQVARLRVGNTDVLGEHQGCSSRVERGDVNSGLLWAAKKKKV